MGGVLTRQYWLLWARPRCMSTTAVRQARTDPRETFIEDAHVGVSGEGERGGCEKESLCCARAAGCRVCVRGGNLSQGRAECLSERMYLRQKACSFGAVSSISKMALAGEGVLTSVYPDMRCVREGEIWSPGQLAAPGSLAPSSLLREVRGLGRRFDVDGSITPG